MRRPVVLTLANPARAAVLAEVAIRIAAARQTGGVLLHIAAVRDRDQPPPDTEPTAWPALAAALEVVRQAHLPVGWIVRSAEEIGQAIRETAAELHACLVILGWRGTSPQQSASLAAVLEDPLCDVAAVALQAGSSRPRNASSIAP
jgi:nucleotide-binding universal stress UspA family protein